MHFPDFMNHTGVPENPLRGGGFTRINVRSDAKISL
jgi:hypothetical protein